jgi:hypothetical protein
MGKCFVCGKNHDNEPWREALGALRLTLTGDPDKVDVPRAQSEVETLTRILNEEH